MRHFRQVTLTLVFVASIALVGFTGPTANAQTTGTDDVNVGTLISGLVNLNVEDINVENVEIVDVTDSLNQNEIRALNNVLNNNTVVVENVDVLTDFLNENNVEIEDNQVVVGVDALSDTVYVISEQ